MSPVIDQWTIASALVVLRSKSAWAKGGRASGVKAVG
jgi:hypothetical protein